MKYTMLTLFLHDKLARKENLRINSHYVSKELLSVIDQRIADNGELDKKKLNFLGLSGHETNIIAFLIGYKLSSLSCLLELLE